MTPKGNGCTIYTNHGAANREVIPQRLEDVNQNPGDVRLSRGIAVYDRVFRDGPRFIWDPNPVAGLRSVIGCRSRIR